MLCFHLFLCLSLAFAQEQRVLLGRGNTLSGWLFASPGGASALTVSELTAPWSGLPFFNLTYDFSLGGWAATISPDSAAILAVPGATALCFSVFRPGAAGESMEVSLVDGSGTSRGSWPYLASPGWTNLTLPFNASDWLPRANGSSLQLPLQGLSIGAGKGNEQSSLGWLGLADVYLLTSAPPGSVPRPVVMGLVQPPGIGNGVLVAGAAPQGSPAALLGVEVVNRLQAACAVNITVALRNSTGPMGEGEWAACAASTLLGPWAAATLSCAIPSDAPAGFVVMRAHFSSASCWSASDTEAVVEGSLAIVPPQPAYTPVARNRHAAVFGGQMMSSPAAAAAVGMWSVRSGPLWEWSQPAECWDPLKCFDWHFYDDLLSLADAGLEVMIDARELAPPWAAARNGSGPTWASIPGPEHYPDYVRWLGLMLDRYGARATMVEVSNEDDGLAYFMPDALPYEYAVNLSLALINLTVAGMAASPSAAGLQLVGLSSSSFDVKQTGNGGSKYMQYERAVLSAQGVIAALDAVSLHPYQNHVWVPWSNPGWGNFSFQFFNESAGWGTNSTTAQLLATAALMKEAAAAAGIADYRPVLRPSEWGYNLIMDVALSDGWALMHAALLAQGLVHFRSAPLSDLVDKAFYFAASDACVLAGGTAAAARAGATRRRAATPPLPPPPHPPSLCSAAAAQSPKATLASGEGRRSAAAPMPRPQASGLLAFCPPWSLYPACPRTPWPARCWMCPAAAWRGSGCWTTAWMALWLAPLAPPSCRPAAWPLQQTPPPPSTPHPSLRSSSWGTTSMTAQLPRSPCLQPLGGC